MRTRTSLAFALPLALALGAGCSEQEVVQERGAVPVVVVPVDSESLEEGIEATGELRARDQAKVAAEVAGRITVVLLDEGEPAEAGQVLLEIDPERRRLEYVSASAGLSEARAALEEQERDHERVGQLHSKGIASEARLDESGTALALARSRAQAAEAQQGVAKRALEDASVRAPFAGLIARRMVSRGEFVQVGQVLFELVALDPIEVEFHLAERDSARVAAGQAVKVVVAPYPEEHFAGTVSMVSPTIDARTRTLRVKATLDNADGRLRPGLFARVDLGISRREGVLLVPEEAVLQRARGQVVFRVGADDVAERLLVEVGPHHQGRVEIVSGLAAGDRVVTRGNAGLVDGMKVSPRNLGGSRRGTTVSTAPDPGAVAR